VFLVSQKINWGFLLRMTRCRVGSRTTNVKASMRSGGGSVTVANFRSDHGIRGLGHRLKVHGMPLQIPEVHLRGVDR
jgi:hypothetical protein